MLFCLRRGEKGYRDSGNLPLREGAGQDVSRKFNGSEAGNGLIKRKT